MHDHERSIGRRRALQCMAWAGTGLFWTLDGGAPRASLIGAAQAASGGLSFVQISDTHIGFNKPANPDPAATLTVALDKIAALQKKPDFIIHTGDITHLSKPKEFDDFDQLAGAAKLDFHYVPGEHDVIDENPGEAFLRRYGKMSKEGAGIPSITPASISSRS